MWLPIVLGLPFRVLGVLHRSSRHLSSVHQTGLRRHLLRVSLFRWPAPLMYQSDSR